MVQDLETFVKYSHHTKRGLAKILGVSEHVLSNAIRKEIPVFVETDENGIITDCYLKRPWGKLNRISEVAAHHR